MVLTAERNYAVPKTPEVRALYNKSFILQEMARKYDVRREEITDIIGLSENTILDKEFLRNIRIDRIADIYHPN